MVWERWFGSDGLGAMVWEREAPSELRISQFAIEIRIQVSIPQQLWYQRHWPLPFSHLRW